MTSRVDSTRQYLLANDAVSKQDKEYALNFCKKTEYLEQLKQALINELHETVASGYGDVNSNICFVFESEKAFQFLKPVLHDIFETVKLDFWDAYITFVDKTQTEYPNKYGLLMHEIHAISPKVLYVIGETDVSYNTLNRAFAMAKVNHPAAKAFHITPELLCSTEEQDRKELWKMFRYLVNYKE
jgi:hypothetical protein